MNLLTNWIAKDFSSVPRRSATKAELAAKLRKFGKKESKYKDIFLKLAKKISD